jgi:hypothetical protein
VADRDVSRVGSGKARSAFARAAVPAGIDSERIHRFVLGIDKAPRVMSDEEAAEELNDPFATLLLRQGIFPADVNAILDAIDAAVSDDHPLHRKSQGSFIVGEGSQIPWSNETASLSRGLRLVVTRGRNKEIDLLISTAATGDPADRFLQVIGWDERKGVFHYYEHEQGSWVWAGNSLHALDPKARGRGPFDSHVNGALVMKELKFPWVHWKSVAASVPPEVFAPDDPARDDRLFTDASGAEFLETSVVIPGVERWTTARFAQRIPEDGEIQDVPILMDQLFTTTTVNLVSSSRESRTIGAEKNVDLPSTFFVDSDTLSTAPIGLAAPPGFSVSGKVYLDTLKRFGVALVDGDFRQEGDTHFAFVVPERAFEDLSVVRRLVTIGVLSPRFVACALMVDFPNPVFSRRRAALAERVRVTATRTAGSSDLVDQAVKAMTSAADSSEEGSAEREFMANWELGEDGWRSEFDSRLDAYYSALNTRLADAAGFDDVFRLAESRRRRVFSTDLSERRPLLFARTNLPADAAELVMQTDATVVEVG